MIYKKSKFFSTNFYCEKCDYYVFIKCNIEKYFKTLTKNDTKKSKNDI